MKRLIFKPIYPGINFLNIIKTKKRNPLLKDIQKEVYEINSWVPAGTQEYFTIELDLERFSNFKWEFVGRKLLKK